MDNAISRKGRAWALSSDNNHTSGGSKAMPNGKNYYRWLWAVTIGLGIIGLFFADYYVGQVTAQPEYSEVYLSDFKKWLGRGSLLFLVLFYFYFKALIDGAKNQRHMSTFIKLLVWFAVVVLVKIIATGLHNAYLLAAVTHLNYAVAFGMLLFPLTALYIAISFIHYKIKTRTSKGQTT